MGSYIHAALPSIWKFTSFGSVWYLFLSYCELFYKFFLFLKIVNTCTINRTVGSNSIKVTMECSAVIMR